MDKKDEFEVKSNVETDLPSKKQVNKVNNLNTAFEKLQKSIDTAKVEGELDRKVVINYDVDKNELDPKLLQENVVTEAEDIKKNKKFAWLAYLLFFIPLCINSKSKFNRFHANEGLDVFFIDVFAGICLLCGKLIKFSAVTQIISHILVLLSLGLFILTTITKIFQIVQVCLGKSTQTPWLWKTRFIK